MKRLIGLICLLSLVLLPALASATPSVFPVGTTIYKPDKTWSGFTILAGTDGRLIDMNGNLVKLWPGASGQPLKVLPGGHLLCTTGMWAHGYQDRMNIEIRNFDDKVVWKFNQWQEGKANQGDGKVWMARQHHDYQIKGNPVGYYIPNWTYQDYTKGTMLVLAHYNVMNEKIHKTMRLLDDVMYEVDMESGKIIWTWKVADHFDELGFDEAAVKAMQSYNGKHELEGTGFDWWHQNCASYLGPNKWFDQGDQRFHPDNIIFDSRQAGTLAILDHKTGKIVWRAGPYYRDGDDKKLGWIIGPHHTHMIPKDLPGGGNVMVYDNGGWSGYGPPNDIAPDGIMNMRRAYTRVIEFNPVTKDIVWEYSPTTLKSNENQFGYKEYSPFISAAQRLPNGNTLITEGSNSRIIEVTKDLEVVWEYISPYTPPNQEGNRDNTVYRAYRVPYEWVPQLPKGKEVEVDPGPRSSFVIPAKDGSKPDMGIGKTPVRK